MHGRYPRSFYLALAANLFFFTGFQWTFATLSGYIQAIGGDATAIGLAFGLFSLSAVAARPVAGWLVDHWGRKPMLLAGAAIFALSPAMYALTSIGRVGGPTPLVLFQVVRTFHGVGIAAFTTAYTALVADLAPPGRRGEAIGLSGATNNVGMLFAPALGAHVVSVWGYTTHFWASAAITALSVLLIVPLIEPVREAIPQGKSPGLWAVARQRPIWAASFAITGLAVAYGAVLGFLPPWAAQQGLTAAGGYFTAFATAMIIAQASAGWLSDRIGRRAVAIPGMTLVVPAMVGVAMVRTNAGLWAAGASFGLGWGLARAGIDTAVVDAVPPETRGTALGFLYTCLDVGVGVGSFGLGVVAQMRGFAAAFFAAALWAVVALSGSLVWGRGSSTRRTAR